MMTVRDFALVVVRLFGLWVLYSCIVTVERLVGGMIGLSGMSPEINHFALLINLFDFLLHAAIGVLLVWKPQMVADRLSPAIGKDGHPRLTATNLILVSFSVVGLVFLITGLAGLIYQAASWACAPKGAFYENRTDWPGISVAAFKTLAGLWLLCRFKGILQGIRWLFKAGRRLGAPGAEDMR